MKKIALSLILLLIIAGVFIIIFTLKLPQDTRLWREIHNTGHTPLFGIVALAAFGLSQLIFPRYAASHSSHYLVALLAALAFGALIEVIQFWTPGDPDILDWLRDAAGALSFLGFHFAFAKRKSDHNGKSKNGLKSTFVVLSVFILLASFTPLGLWIGAYIVRNSALPVICDFDSYGQNKFLYARMATLDITRESQPWDDEGNGHFGKVQYRPSKYYPSLIIDEPYPDWTAYGNFKFVAFNPYDTTVHFGLRIDDFPGKKNHPARFDSLLGLRPGQNNIRVSIEAIGGSDQVKRTDLKRIKAIQLYAIRPDRPLTLYFDNFRLE